MKTKLQRFTACLLAVLMLCATLAPTALGITVLWEDSMSISAASSTEAPEGYVPRASQFLQAQELAEGEDVSMVPKVLLVQDVLPWDSDANANVLGSITEFSIVSTAEFLTVDLSEYGVIVFANDQPFSSYDNYVAFSEHIELFASIGGVIVFGACDAGWSQGDLAAALPGGVTKTNNMENNNYIVDSNHSIVTGELTDGIALTNEDLQSQYCSHISFVESSLPAGTTIILRDSGEGLPTLIEYPLGKGRVIASGLTWEHNYGRKGETISGILVGGFAERALDDLYTYAIRVSMIDVNDIYLLKDLYLENNAHAIIAADGSENITDLLPVEGATVTIEDVEETFTTNENGAVLTDVTGERLVSVSAKNYRERKMLYTLKPRESRIFYLEAAKNDGLPYLVQATGFCTKADDYVDLRDQSVSFTEDSTVPMSAYFEANWNGHGEGTFELYQEATANVNGAAISIPAGNFLNFTPGKVFSPNKAVYVKMVAADGTESEPVKLNIAIAKKPVENAGGSETALQDGVSTFDWIGNHTVASNDDIFTKLLTTDMSIKSDLSPVEIAIEHNDDGTVTYKGIIGLVSGEYTKSILNSKAAEKENGIKAPVEEAWNEWKKQIKNYKKAGDPESYLKQLKKKYSKDWHPTKLRVAAEFTGDVCGYLEITLNQANEVVHSEGGLIVQFAGNASIGQTFFAGPVPIYYEFKPGIEVKAGGGIEFYNEEGWTFRPNFDGVELALPSITLEGGVGVRGVATVGLQGSGKMLFGFEGDGKTSGALEIGGAIHAKVLFVVDYTWNFWNTKINLWPKMADDTRYLYEVAFEEEGADYVLTEREHLNQYGWWDGYSEVLDAETGETYLTTLQTGVMPDAMPTIHQVGDTQVLLMLMDDGASEIGNHTRLVYSVCSDGYWSDPQPVFDEDGADFFYDAAVIDGTLYVAWQKASKKTRSDEAADILADLAETSEICIAVWNARKVRFDTCKYVTDDNVLDMMPALGQCGESVSLAWVSNNENNLVGFGGTNSIRHVLIDGKNIGEVTTLAETEDYITELVNGSNEDGVSVLYSLWTANGEAALRYAGSSRGARVATEFAPAGLAYDNGTYTWLENGTVYSYLPSQASPRVLLEGALSSSYRFVSNGDKQAFVWTESGDTTRILAAVCVDGTWCEPITLMSGIESTVNFFDVILRDNGNFLLVLNTARYADYGLDYSGLQIAEISPAADLTLLDAYVSEPDWDANKQEITAYVRNSGTTVVETIKLALYNEYDLLEEFEMNVRLLPGEETSVEVITDLNLVEATSEVNLCLSTNAEQNLDDNEKTITIAQVDVSLSYTTYERGDNLVFALTVSNAAAAPANVALNVYQDQMDGIRLDVKNLGSVTSDTVVQYFYAVDRAEIEFGDSNSKNYFFCVSSLEEDWNDCDNNCFYSVSELVYDEVDPNGEIVAVTLVDPTEVVLDVEELIFDSPDADPYQLIATVLPENAAVTEVTWSVENGDIVHVNSRGLVTPLRCGTTELTATVISGVSVTISVTVQDPNAPLTDSGEEEAGGFSLWLWIIIGGAAVLIIGAVTVILLVARGKKKGKTPPKQPTPPTQPIYPQQPYMPPQQPTYPPQPQVPSQPTAPMTAPPPQAPVTPPKSAPTAQFCSRCGTPRKPGGAFCEQCGFRFPQ